MSDQPGGEDFEELLRFVKEVRGFDFTGYKRASLTRRIEKRMQAAGAASYAEYQRLLDQRPEEFGQLFDTILINVTSFQRDREAWAYLAESVVPRIVAGKDDDSPIRVWSAGCASGEEAYSLAVLLCDVLGEERFRQRVKIYGTDADDAALTDARHARYADKSVRESFSADQVERYFDPEDSHLTFRKDLRRGVIFGRHDLVQDPPISRVDLIVCRNTLMYFTAEVQRRVLSSFHFAINDDGFLFLGKSEALVSRTQLFAVDDLKRHVFVKRTGTAVRPPLPGTTPIVVRDQPPEHTLLSSAIETSPHASIVLDRESRIVVANRLARTLFGIGRSQIGRPFRDLEVSFRPAELRSPVEEALNDHRAATLNEVQFEGPGGVREFLDIHVTPLGSDTNATGVSLVFEQVGSYKTLREDLERSQRDLETAYEELQSTVEELETTNEELQSTNEELETTNEELHSTNEELETMNEELQSTNEELETINNELRERSLELDDLSSFLQSILSGLGAGIVVLNRDLGVRIWNRQAEDLWGLRADEVEGSHFLNLDIGLPVDRLRAPIRSCLSGTAEVEQVQLEAIDRRGRTVQCQVQVSPLRYDGARSAVEGVIVVMDRIDP